VTQSGPDVAAALEEVRGRIRAVLAKAGDPREVTLVAITKTVPLALIEAAHAAGQRVFGESRVQEAETKIRDFPGQASWHMVGHLQSNKVKTAVRLFDCIHSVDSLRLLEEIDRRAAEAGRTPEILIEVNTSGEARKFGVSPEEAPKLVEEAFRRPHLRASGLMTVGPLGGDPKKTREAFRRLRDLRDALSPRHPTLVHLSMGMTSDYPLAIEEGSTMLRIGTAIFGPREVSE
jgi:hypothetical protein